jgi:hypothetical protein
MIRHSDVLAEDPRLPGRTDLTAGPSEYPGRSACRQPRLAERFLGTARVLRLTVRPGSHHGAMNIGREEFDVLSREATALGWLRRAITRAEFVRLDDDQLISCAGDLEDDARQAVLTELEIRLARGNPSLVLKVQALLAELHRRWAQPGRPAQHTDRMLDRFLHRLPRNVGAELALTCARCPRLGRRRAAWHFYRIHGHDDASRDVFTAAFPEGDRWEFLRSVVDDVQLITAIGVPRCLDHLGEFYWRGRALTTILRADSEAFGAVAPAFPEEALFAIYTAGGVADQTLAFALLNAHPDDPGVCSAAIRVFGALGAKEELDVAIAHGHRILENTNNPFLRS